MNLLDGQETPLKNIAQPCDDYREFFRRTESFLGINLDEGRLFVQAFGFIEFCLSAIGNTRIFTTGLLSRHNFIFKVIACRFIAGVVHVDIREHADLAEAAHRLAGHAQEAGGFLGGDTFSWSCHIYFFWLVC